MESSPGSVLIIEDDPDLRALLARLMAPHYDVVVVDDGADALLRFESGHRFDAVLCDLEMPRMDGATLLTNLRRLDPEQADRVIILTGNLHTPLSSQLGCYCIVEKPFVVRLLKQLIDRVIAAAQSGYFPGRTATG